MANEFDSIKQREKIAADMVRNAKLDMREQEEHKRLQDEHQARRDAEIRETEDKDIQQIHKLSDIGTRDELLSRIREMREPPPSPPELPLGHGRVSIRMIDEFNAEQEAGRAAVAKAEAELQRGREMRKRIEEEEKLRQGTMEPVFHPNPGQGEMFPSSGATLGKKK